MKTFTITAPLLFLASLARTAPAPVPAQTEARQVLEVGATFYGAGPNPPSYTEDTIPAGGEVFPISTSTAYHSRWTPVLFQYHLKPPSDFATANPLSVSHITLFDSATCTFYGVDGSETTITNSGPASTTADVGPPQAQVSAVCLFIN